ncbi:AAA family ATPase, partial [Acinetobacter baumannii]|uniref:AAA family ATPase n=2 Tax=Acinetobacter TaxID=469 RepID=UPI00312CBA76
FFKSQLNNLGIPLPVFGQDDDDSENFENNNIIDLDFNENSDAMIHGLSKQEIYEIEKISQNEKNELEKFFDSIFKTDFFKEKKEETIKYETIFIDEIQDFEVKWLEIIATNFLAEDGEVVLFGDQNQNIYQREINKQEFPITRGFGYWKNLRISHRQNEKTFADLFNHYKINFLNNYTDQLEYDIIENLEFSFSELQYIKINSPQTINATYDFIFKKIKTLNVSPNDIAIISSKIDFLRALQQCFNHHQRTDSTFESQIEYQEIQNMFDNRVAKFL